MPRIFKIGNQLTPLGGGLGPDNFEATGDGVGSLARLVLVVPAKTLLLNGSCVGLVSDVVRRGSAVGLAEGVATSNQSHSLLVIHGHAAEGSADIPASSDWVGHTIGSLRVDVDQAHVGGGQWIFKIALVNILVLLLMLVGIDDTATGNTSLAVRVADIVAQPGSLSTPVDGLICLPLVWTATGEAKSLDTHGLEGDYVDLSTKYEFPERTSDVK